MSTVEFVVVDTETTGLNQHENRIIQIGAVAISGGKVVETWESKLRFIEGVVSEESMKINGLNLEELRHSGQPLPRQVMETLISRFLGPGVVLVCHNLPFDLGFMQETLHREGLPPWDGRFIDTRALAKVLLPDIKPNLRVVAPHLGIDLVNHHDALADARATAAILPKLLAMAERAGVDPHNLLVDSTERPIQHRPPNARILSEQQLDELITRIRCEWTSGVKDGQGHLFDGNENMTAEMLRMAPFMNEFTMDQVKSALANVVADGRNEVQYQVFDEEGNDAVQSITRAEASLIINYLQDRPDVRFMGKNGSLPMFKHVLESSPFTLSEAEWPVPPFRTGR